MLRALALEKVFQDLAFLELRASLCVQGLTC
jgi:hypothetical protein